MASCAVTQLQAHRLTFSNATLLTAPEQDGYHVEGDCGSLATRKSHLSVSRVPYVIVVGELL